MAKGVELKKVPKGATIIEGFPGFGLVATITTGFLQDHLKCEQIGSYWFEDQMPTLAVHGCKLVDPIGIFYNKQYNIIMVHSIASAQGNEWRFADFLIELAKKTQAKEIISLEGVGSTAPGATQGFFYTENAVKRKKFEKYGIDCLGEGIIVGVTSALLLKAKSAKVPVTCLFAETASKLPDSKASAKVIEMLDKYLGLKVDPKPLLKQAEEFEEKLKEMIVKQKEVKKTVSKKDISYLG